MQRKVLATEVQLDLSTFSRDVVAFIDYLSPLIAGAKSRQLVLKLARDLDQKTPGFYPQLISALRKVDQAGGPNSIDRIIHPEGNILNLTSLTKKFLAEAPSGVSIAKLALLEESKIYPLLLNASQTPKDAPKELLIKNLATIRETMRQELLLLAAYLYTQYGDDADQPLVGFAKSFLGGTALERLNEAIMTIHKSTDLELCQLFYKSVLARTEQQVNYLLLAKTLLIFGDWQKKADYVKLFSHLQEISSNDLKLIAVMQEQALGTLIGPDKAISTGLKIYLEANNNHYVVRLDTPHKGENYFHVNIEKFSSGWETHHCLSDFYVRELAASGKAGRNDLETLLSNSIQRNTTTAQELSAELQHATAHFPMTCWDNAPETYSFFISQLIEKLPAEYVIYDHHERDEKNLEIIIQKQTGSSVLWHGLYLYLLNQQLSPEAKNMLLGFAKHHCQQTADDCSYQILADEKDDHQFMVDLSNLLAK